MEIITGTEHDLRQLINGAYQRIDRSSNNLERYALADYLTQLHEAERIMTGKESDIDLERCFRTNSKYRKYSSYLNKLFSRLDDEFIKFKEYHQDHFDAMLALNDDELEDVVDKVYSDEYTVMSKEEFSQYFFEFLSEYGLVDAFDRFISGRKIFNRPFNEDEKYAGTIIHDPVKKKSSIFMCEFDYTVPYLLTLGHEFGHTYDVNKFNKRDIDPYMRYSYSSIYGETIAMVFEKLFYDFLFRKKYRVDEVKEIYSEFSFENKNCVLDGYILSQLPDEVIRRLACGVSDGEIVECVSDSFTKLDEVLEHLDGRTIDTWKTPLYAYGDYFSTILKDSVEQDGLDNKLMRRFMDFRTKEFNPEVVTDVWFEMGDYQKVYRKDISRLKN